MTTIVGIALSGVPLSNGLTTSGVDPLYPIAYGSVSNATAAKESVDKCMGHVLSNGVYHYHLAPTCIGNPLIGTNSSSCNADP